MTRAEQVSTVKAKRKSASRGNEGKGSRERTGFRPDDGETKEIGWLRDLQLLDKLGEDS